ncbi:hypothetical protein BOTBODRAFT_241914 [Botryobasidium botryosum FD-172 SS1]|uniref:ER transporter 6TM N-terminal domain-containing protein n=1 Tax=Botryobasidium botryosum (strain FD-172 SS1) TaxID=930990 RepID=A0A067MYB3_BOTB1|nr:hypothetical protein BOTBODRAFT_241914 [Botryobasidium botryosum FD-172 SS1]
MWLVELLQLDKWKSWSARRTIFRCWLAAWLCALAILIRPLEKTAGQAAFLPLIFIFIKPPSEPTPVFVTQSLFAGVVILATWAWCTLGMKFALLARNHAKDQAILQRLSITVLQHDPHATPAEIEAQLSAEIFKGAFLQLRSSVVWAFFFFLGTYALFLIRAYNVRLFFVMTFSLILLLIQATIAPLVPQFYAIQLSSIYLIPYSYYLAITLFCSIFVFPTSVASTTMEGLAASTRTALTVQALSPEKIRAMEKDEIAAAVEKHAAVRAGGVSLFDSMQFTVPWLGHEISVGKASGKDVKRLFYRTRAMSMKAGALTIFLKHAAYRKKHAVDEKIAPSDSSNISLSLDTLFEDLTNSTSEYFAAIIQGIQALHDFYERQSRWDAGVVSIFRSTNDVAGLQSSLDQIDEASRAEKRGLLSSGLNHKRDGETPPSYLHELYLAFLDRVVEDLRAALRLAMEIDGRKGRIWWPGAQKSYASSDEKENAENDAHGHGLLGALGGGEDVPSGEDNPDVIDGVAPTAPTSLELPAPAKPSNIIPSDTVDERPAENLGTRVYKIFAWFLRSESLFALKIAFLAVALACPAWITNNGTASFYYREKGLWVLVTAMTSKGMYSSDTTYGFLQRVIGCVLGGVIGMVMWYISAGNGRGNAYGLAAVFAVVLLFGIPYRIWSSNFLLAVTCTTTAALVVGYSWMDETIPVLGNPGVGYQIFWKRTLLVLIGLTAAFIADLLPKPKFGREELRRSYSVITLELGAVTAAILRRVTLAENDEPTAQATPNMIATELKVLAIYNKLRLSSMRIMLGRFEPSIRKKWSAAHYLSLQSTLFDISDSLAVLAVACEAMTPEENAVFNASSAMKLDQIHAMLNIFHAASSALATQRPLPHMLPSPYHVVSTKPNPSLDTELAVVLGPQSSHTLIIAEGTLIVLAKLSERLAQQCQVLFGTTFVIPV